MIAILAIYTAIVISGFFLSGFLFRRRFRLALVVLFLLTPTVLFGWYQATRIDLVASWFYPSDTVYSADFSPHRFRTVSKGMRREDLVDRLGPPLEKRIINDRREYWYYSRRGERFQNYWNFIVIVDPINGKVIEKFKEFYTD
jgi:hypothetical protein